MICLLLTVICVLCRLYPVSIKAYGIRLGTKSHVVWTSPVRCPVDWSCGIQSGHCRWMQLYIHPVCHWTQLYTDECNPEILSTSKILNVLCHRCMWVMFPETYMSKNNSALQNSTEVKADLPLNIPPLPEPSVEHQQQLTIQVQKNGPFSKTKDPFSLE